MHYQARYSINQFHPYFSTSFTNMLAANALLFSKPWDLASSSEGEVQISYAKEQDPLKSNLNLSVLF